MTLAYVLVGVCLIGSAIAGCKEDLMKDNDYLKCLMDFSNYIQENLGDPNEMINVMCGEPAKKKLRCVMGYAKTCSEIFDDAAGIGDMLSHMKNLDAMCAMVNGGMGGNTGGTHGGGSTTVITGGDVVTPDSTCAQVFQCMHGKPPNSSPDTDSNHRPIKNQFSDIQQSLAAICGPMKESLECLDRFEDQCPDQVDAVRETISSASQGEAGNQPDFDSVLKFISDECTKIPDTFSTNRCVREQIDSSELEQCYSQVTRAYGSSEAEMKSCPAYLAGRKCIDETVGKCGAAEARVLVQAMHLMLADLPTHCAESSATSVQASLATLFTMLVLYLAHFKF